jgi:diphosphomevalonate decarboxylase
MARKLSGSASRSVYGGFVEWDTNGISTCFKDENYWDDLSIILLIVSDNKKDYSSTDGMKISVDTSDYLKYRIDNQVPERLKSIKNAIEKKDYNQLYKITIMESNSLHAVCRDTYPSLNYLNDTSNFIIKCVNLINSEFENKSSDFQLKCGYTFDAGPNSWIITSNKYKKSIIEFFEILINKNYGLTEKLDKIIKINDLDVNKVVLSKLISEQVEFEYNIEKIVSFRPGKGCYMLTD